jgi:hypothetical protein
VFFKMNVLSSLHLIEIERICLHEPTENVRLTKTLQEIQTDGFLRNPLLATPMQNGRFLLLDGAHRTHALQALHCKRVPLQVINSTDIQLDAWEHLVAIGEWLEQLKQDPTLYWSSTTQQNVPMIEIMEPNGIKHCVYFKEKNTQLDTWHRIVSSYNKHNQVHRVPKGSYLSPDKDQVLLRHPTLTLTEIKEVASQNRTVPAGVTRFMVQGRLLNLNIPINLLTSSSTDKIRWDKLCTEWSKKLRHYSEGVYLCEV